MRRTSARLAQLRAHLYRTKWRDKQAEDTYWTLILAQKAVGPSVNLVCLDAILKDYYSPTVFDRAMLECNASLRFMTKKHSNTLYVHPVEHCPPDRIYCISDFIPEATVAHFVDDDPPIKTHPASKEYRDNYDRVFGGKEPELTHECGCAGATVRNCPYQGDVNNDDKQRCKCCDSCAYECAMDV